MNIFQVLINYVYAFFIDNTLKLYLYNQLFDISEECPNEKSPEINLKGKSTQLRDIITYDISKNDSKIILEEFKEEKSQIRKGSNGKLEDQKKSKLLKNQIRKVNNLGNNQKFNADIQNYISYKKIERNKIKIHFCVRILHIYTFVDRKHLVKRLNYYN